MLSASEIERLTKYGISSAQRLLAIACRQLAENAESNNRYEEASRFRHLAIAETADGSNLERRVLRLRVLEIGPVVLGYGVATVNALFELSRCYWEYG